MWAWQQHFRISVENTAERLFESLDPNLEPKVFVVGFLTKEREDRHPICIEPEDEGWYEPSHFSEVPNFAKYLAEMDDENSIVHSDPRVQQRREQYIKGKGLRDAVEKVLRQYDQFENTFSFCSFPTLVDDYMVCCVLELNKAAYHAHYKLNQDKIKDRYPVETSLLNSSIELFLGLCTKALKEPNAGENLVVIDRSSDELIREAARLLMSSPMERVADLPNHHFFDSCNIVASLRYEGKEGVGRLLVAKRNHPNIKPEVVLKTPVSFSDYRSVRKLLEMTRGEICLLSDGDGIYGLGRQVGNYKSHAEDLFSINFLSHHKWELIHAGQSMMVVDFGQPRLPAAPINEKKFKSDLRRLFSAIDGSDVELLWSLALAATEQKHGTILVISNAAAEEAGRLARQSTVIEPLNLTVNEMLSLTAIDGAILIEPNGRCHAIGVILDGLATTKGKSSRGSRYNSAVRYVETARNEFKHECLAIVISEDGMIDLVPDLMPQIKRSLIDEAVEKLRKNKEAHEVNIKEYNHAMDWLQKHEFYLLPEVVEQVNELKSEIDARLKNSAGVRILWRDLAPNAEMNESYFLD